MPRRRGNLMLSVGMKLYLMTVEERRQSPGKQSSSLRTVRAAFIVESNLNNIAFLASCSVLFLRFDCLVKYSSFLNVEKLCQNLKTKKKRRREREKIWNIHEKQRQRRKRKRKVETHDDKKYFNGASERFINLWECLLEKEEVEESNAVENPWERFLVSSAAQFGFLNLFTYGFCGGLWVSLAECSDRYWDWC